MIRSLKRLRRKPRPETKSKLWSMKKADDEFSLHIRERDGHTCKRCGKHYPMVETEKGMKRKDGLTCSHFWGRAHKGTRYDPENCVAVCWMPCHKYYWEKEKQGDYRNFMLRWLGKKRYDELERRARGTKPLSEAIIECMRLVGK